MREMADACNSAALPGWQLQATYVDGGCQVNRNDKVRISSVATNDGNVGDVEPGNPYWPTWISWTVQRRQAGIDPSLYCCDDGYGTSFFDGWRHNDGVAAFAAAGVPEPHWWIFNFNISEPPSYAMAVQVATNIGPGYDISIVRDYWPGIDPLPVRIGDDNMLYLMREPTSGAEYITNGEWIVHIPDPASVQAFKDGGISMSDGVSQQTINLISQAMQSLQSKITGPINLQGTIQVS